MPTVKATYEAVFIFSTALAEEGIAAIKSKFEQLIADNAELGKVDEWGTRRLAYPIQDETEGFYVLYNFVSGPEFPAELERVAKITDGVLRDLVVRKDEKAIAAEAAAEAAKAAKAAAKEAEKAAAEAAAEEAAVEEAAVEETAAEKAEEE